jgi:hypothetical protein
MGTVDMPYAQPKVDTETFRSSIASTYNEDCSSNGLVGRIFKKFVTTWANAGTRNGSLYAISVQESTPIRRVMRPGDGIADLLIDVTELHPPIVSQEIHTSSYRLKVVGDRIGVLAAASWRGQFDTAEETWNQTPLERDHAQIIDRVHEIAGIIENPIYLKSMLGSQE